uniref:Tc1-like transposase DDE domain-containing protein n=1 Tax=Pygocentrus nattereri TaxID=42514 RepID=A0AAR2LSB3_PYGNA
MGIKVDLRGFERAVVVGARRAGLSISETADLLGFSHTTISRVYRERSEKRKYPVSGQGQKRMGRLVPDDRKATITQITTCYNQGMQNTTSEWKNVAWSDESRFQLRHSDGRVRIWHKHESMDPSLLLLTIRIMHHVTKLISSQTGFLNMTVSSNVLQWPPHSADLNPIEHLWDVVKWEIRIIDVQLTNLQQLRDEHLGQLNDGLPLFRREMTELVLYKVIHSLEHTNSQ